MTCPTERAVAANLFFSFGTVGENGEVTMQPHDLRRMLQSMGVVSTYVYTRDMASPPPTSGLLSVAAERHTPLSLFFSPRVDVYNGTYPVFSLLGVCCCFRCRVKQDGWHARAGRKQGRRAHAAFGFPCARLCVCVFRWPESLKKLPRFRGCCQQREVVLCIVLTPMYICTLLFWSRVPRESVGLPRLHHRWVRGRPTRAHAGVVFRGSKGLNLVAQSFLGVVALSVCEWGHGQVAFRREKRLACVLSSSPPPADVNVNMDGRLRSCLPNAV